MVDIFIKDSIKKEDDLLCKSLILVNNYFNDKVDKDGVPYINHLFYVRDSVKTEEEKIVGLLHDLVEDTAITFHDLQELGFPNKIIDSLRLLTRDKSTPYSEYIDNILCSNDLVAIKVKHADMKHNMNKQRLQRLDELTRIELIQKYQNQYEKINEYLKER